MIVEERLRYQLRGLNQDVLLRASSRRMAKNDLSLFRYQVRLRSSGRGY